MRLINQGYTGAEIAEQFELPPALQRAWHAHGYYGSVSHNVKAIYQRYLGWYDGATYRTTLRNGVFSYVRDGSGDVTATITVPRAALAALAAGDLGAARAAGLTLDGDAAAVQQFAAVLQRGNPAFNIVEP